MNFLGEESRLLIDQFYWSGAFLVVVGDVIDAAAHGIATRLAGVVGLQQIAATFLTEASIEGNRS